jgi:hypothetical protein
MVDFMVEHSWLIVLSGALVVILMFIIGDALNLLLHRWANHSPPSAKQR